MIQLLLSLIIFVSPPGNDIAKARVLFLAAVENEDKATELLKFTEKASRSDALLLGYQGIAKTLLGKHAFNPVNKVSYFNKGKKVLEEIGRAHV